MKKVDYMVSERAKPVVLFILYYNYFLSFYQVSGSTIQNKTQEITFGT